MRAIQLEVDDKGLPLSGRVAAGVMHEAIEQNERLDFDALFNNKRKDSFAPKVSGDSMVDAHIDDGDYVIIRKQHNAVAGQIVVAQTEEGEATLKYYFPERQKKRIRLQPANFVDEADLCERLPRAGRSLRRATKSGVIAKDSPHSPCSPLAFVPRGFFISSPIALSWSMNGCEMRPVF